MSAECLCSSSSGVELGYDGLQVWHAVSRLHNAFQYAVHQQEDRLEPQVTTYAALLGILHLLCFVYKHHGIKALLGEVKQ